MKLEIYKAKRGWEIRIKTRNGRYIVGSRQGYRNLGDAKRMAEKLMNTKTWIYKVVDDE